MSSASLSGMGEERRRIYEYVEQRGAVDPEEVRANVLVRPESASKPHRSGDRLQPAVPLEREAFVEHVDALKRDGYLVEDDAKLRVAVPGDDDAETFDADGDAVTVRPARQEDIAGVVGAIRSVAADRTHVVAEHVAEELDRDDVLIRHNDRESRMFFVATVDGDVVGWSHVQGPQFAKLGHTAELTTGVVEAYRRHGIGRHLMDRALAWARAEGYRKGYQSVPATNEEAVEFLEAAGWTVEATREGHYCIDDELVDEVQLAVWLDERER